MANNQIEGTLERSIVRCKGIATEWRVSVSHCLGRIGEYNVGDSVVVTEGFNSESLVYCDKESVSSDNLGNGIVLHVDSLVLAVCWKPKDNE